MMPTFRQKRETAKKMVPFLGSVPCSKIYEGFRTLPTDYWLFILLSGIEIYTDYTHCLLYFVPVY